MAGFLDCTQEGFNVIEADNFDTYTREGVRKLLTRDDNFQLAKLLADFAHSIDLSIGQKNTTENFASAKSAVGFGFAVAEQCQEF
ncbi:hypothetical protein L218DRAFT_968297 [Marasmius fiardii PR-910]|nr:hypothetical protein L218DRAFT_968297 [Marasmius fiardii PR-910]